MKIDKISDDLIISKKINDCYLLYTKKNYYLFKPDDDSYSFAKFDISENADAVENTFTYDKDNDKISNDPVINSSLTIMMVHLEYLGLKQNDQHYTIQRIFEDLANVEYYIENPDDTDAESYDRNKRFADITDILSLSLS